VYAIIEDRGTQIKVAPGDVIDIDVMRPGKTDSAESSKKLTFDRVLLVKGADDAEATVGAPYVDGASVDAEVVQEILGEKLDVVMYKRRKGQRRKLGHRQRYLRVKITGINA
jgi:large subunit ribosomal protein L21